ncbi:Os07g0507100 [Oryza sativa Japonica Group]|uniref:Os07g0507100 protein n=1 Tax=Oryza sativa subsp. japonica TaxID=39947 RepID=A0A0P0X768_ORYSJ|nr:Os07g0507100 [Oryza sativa Japonica Group]
MGGVGLSRRPTATGRQRRRPRDACVGGSKRPVLEATTADEKEVDAADYSGSKLRSAKAYVTQAWCVRRWQEAGTVTRLRAARRRPASGKLSWYGAWRGQGGSDADGRPEMTLAV